MGHKSIFAVLAFLFSAVAYVPYVALILTGDARPTISSWISWGIMDAVILTGMILAGEMAWQMVAYIIGVTVILGSSVWKGAAMGWTRLDSICLVIVIVAAVLWILSKKASVLIVLGLIATVIGSIPTVVSVWNDPAHEPLLPWLLIAAGGVCGVLAIKKWNIAAAATPVSFLILQTTILFLMIR